MKYYRFPDDLKPLIERYRHQMNQRSDLFDVIAQHHQLTGLGQFGGTTDKGIVLSTQLNKQPHVNIMPIAPAALDFIINDNVYYDVFVLQETVELYGRCDGGKLTDIVALNHAAIAS